MNKFNPQDKFFKRAKDEGYRARSAFKLEGIQERYTILKPGMKVLDLGAAPGSFMQYISKVVGDDGLVIGIDLKEIEDLKLNNVETYQADVFDDDVYRRMSEKKFDVITADLAPKTSGIKSMDGAKSLELNLRALEISHKHLKRGGSLIMKILSGFNEGSLVGEANKAFKIVRKFKPEAIRKSSHESYVCCFKKL